MGIIDLVYPNIFYFISHFMDPSIREGWTFLSLLRVAKVYFLFFWKMMDKVTKTSTLRLHVSLSELRAN